MDRIPVFYRPEQTAPPQPGSPSPSKPALVLVSWLEQRLRPVLDLHDQTMGACAAVYVRRSRAQ